MNNNYYYFSTHVNSSDLPIGSKACIFISLSYTNYLKKHVLFVNGLVNEILFYKMLPCNFKKNLIELLHYLFFIFRNAV